MDCIISRRISSAHYRYNFASSTNINWRDIQSKISNRLLEQYFLQETSYIAYMWLFSSMILELFILYHSCFLWSKSDRILYFIILTLNEAKISFFVKRFLHSCRVQAFVMNRIAICAISHLTYHHSHEITFVGCCIFEICIQRDSLVTTNGHVLLLLPFDLVLFFLIQVGFLWFYCILFCFVMRLLRIDWIFLHL